MFRMDSLKARKYSLPLSMSSLNYNSLEISDNSVERTGDEDIKQSQSDKENSQKIYTPRRRKAKRTTAKNEERFSKGQPKRPLRSCKSSGINKSHSEEIVQH